MFRPEGLDPLLELCEEKGVLKVADEVFTGFGRTGTFYASEKLHQKPDIMGVSKGLTGGAMALAATLCRDEIQEPFISEDRYKTFFHGHSFTGNPIACAAGCANMELMAEDAAWEGIRRVEKAHARFMERAETHPKLKELRRQGTILAMEVKSEGEASYFNPMRDRIHAHFLEKGILLRPLGNEIYIVPPYCVEEADLERVYNEIEEFADQYGE